KISCVARPRRLSGGFSVLHRRHLTNDDSSWLFRSGSFGSLWNMQRIARIDSFLSVAFVSGWIRLSNQVVATKQPLSSSGLHRAMDISSALRLPVDVRVALLLLHAKSRRSYWPEHRAITRDTEPAIQTHSSGRHGTD